MSPAVRCRAKNPATCRTHGTATPAPHAPVDAVTEDIFDAFEAAMKRSPGYLKIEAQLKYSERKQEELAEKYALRNPPVVADHHRIPYGDDRLKQYNAEYEQVYASWTDAEKESMKQYTAIMHTPVNEHLLDPNIYAKRFKGDAEKHAEQLKRVEAYIRNLDTALAKHQPTKEPRTLYRVLTQDLTGRFTSAEDFARQLNLVPGSTVTFPTYCSTTIDPGFVSRWSNRERQHTAVVLQFHTKQGTPTGRTAETSAEHHFTQDTEREYLLQRNTTWKVVSITRERYHQDAANDEDGSVEPLTVHLAEA